MAASAAVALSLLVMTGAGAAEPESVGLVDTGQGLWHLRHDDGSTTTFFYGDPGDVPFTGDWDCDGDDTPGLYRFSDGFAYLRNSNTAGIADIRFFFGNPGDVPLAGDFDGDGCDTLSLYRPGSAEFFIINELGSESKGLGAAEFSFVFGDPGDTPVVGDWDGDGIDEIGLHRVSTGLFYWRDTLTPGVADGSIVFGNPGDRFFAGEFGPIDGKDSPALFRPDDATFYIRHTLTQGVADEVVPYGLWYMRPIAGNFGLPDVPFAGRTWATKTIADGGSFASLTFNRDGSPFIAYGERIAGLGFGSERFELKLADCNGLGCKSTTITPTGHQVTDPTSLATAGIRPIGIFYDSILQQAYFLRCYDDACRNRDVVPLVPRGVLSSLAVGTDGKPIAAYLDSSDTNLRSVQCTLGPFSEVDRTCPSPLVNILDFGPVNFERMDIAIGADDLPVISYVRSSPVQPVPDKPTKELRAYHCDDAACTDGTISVVIPGMPDLGTIDFTSIAIGTDGKPLIALGRLPFGSESVGVPGIVTAACADAACTSATVTTHGPAATASYVSLAIGADGLPLIAYRNDGTRTLELLRCLTADCSGATETYTIDGATGTGEFASLRVDHLGRPWVAYYDRGADSLRLAYLR